MLVSHTKEDGLTATGQKPERSSSTLDQRYHHTPRSLSHRLLGPGSRAHHPSRRHSTPVLRRRSECYSPLVVRVEIPARRRHGPGLHPRRSPHPPLKPRPLSLPPRQVL